MESTFGPQLGQTYGIWRGKKGESLFRHKRPPGSLPHREGSCSAGWQTERQMDRQCWEKSQRQEITLAQCDGCTQLINDKTWGGNKEGETFYPGSGRKVAFCPLIISNRSHRIPSLSGTRCATVAACSSFPFQRLCTDWRAANNKRPVNQPGIHKVKDGGRRLAQRKAIGGNVRLPKTSIHAHTHTHWHTQNEYLVSVNVWKAECYHLNEHAAAVFCSTPFSSDTFCCVRTRYYLMSLSA